MAAEQVRGDTRPTGGRQLGEQVATGGLSFGYCESMSRNRRRGAWNQKSGSLPLRSLLVNSVKRTTQPARPNQPSTSLFPRIPDSDEERGANGSSLLGDDDEYVPETGPQDVVPVSRIIGPRQCLGTMLHDWLQIISHVDNGSDKMDMKSNKVQLGDLKLEKEITKVQMDDVKLEIESVKLEKEELDSVKLEEDLDHMVSFFDIETDDEACLFLDGVDLRGHSQVEDDDFNDQVMD